MNPPRKDISLAVLTSSDLTKINLIFLVIFFPWPLLGMTRVRPHFVSLLVRIFSFSFKLSLICFFFLWTGTSD